MTLKNLSNFWRALDIPLIDCETSLVSTWSEKWVLTDIVTHAAVAAKGDNPAKPASNAQIKATLKIIDIKLYVPVVNLSTDDDNKLLEQLKTGFKRTIKWNKYRSEISNQAKSSNCNYLIDPTYNRLWIISAFIWKWRW